MLKICVLVALVLVLTSGDDSDDLYVGQRHFSGNLLDSLRQLNPKQNLFFSPHSIYRTLLIAFLGARGATEHSLAKGLFLQLAGLENKADLVDAYKRELNARLRRTRTSIVLNSVDKLYITKDAQLKSHISDVFRNNEIELVDFMNPEQIRAEINSLVEQVTDGQIKELMPPGSVMSSMNAVMVNAAYFKGTWKNKFESYQTKDITFRGDETESKAQLMLNTVKLNWGQLTDVDATYIELPYTVDQITDSVSMYVYLPNKDAPGALDEMLEKFSGNTIQRSLNRVSFRQVRVGLPKMKMEGKYYLGEALKQIYFGDLIGGDYGGFADNVEVTFDDILHIAKVQVDEEGTTAVAATATMSRGGGYDPNVEQFICDRPFMFLIADGSSKEVLFMGVYRGPEPESQQETKQEIEEETQQPTKRENHFSNFFKSLFSS